MSKSQVTIFIIFGIVILAIFAFVYYMISGINLNYSDTPVDGYMRECMHMEGKYIFQELGKTGGRFQNNTYNSSYLLRGNNKMVPSLSEINSELKKRFNKSIDRCMNNYRGREEITKLNPEYEFIYSSNTVRININKPYKVDTGAETIYKGKIPVRLDIRLKPILTMVNKTLDDYRADGYIYEDYLLEGLRLYVKQEGSNRLFLIRDRESSEYYQPYLFRFVVEK